MTGQSRDFGEVAGHQVPRVRPGQRRLDRRAVSRAFQQRLRNRQPPGWLSGPGASPASRIRRRPARAAGRGSGTGTADSSACVYGCRGAAYSESPSASSTILPRYITATRSEMCRTTDRSCAMNR